MSPQPPTQPTPLKKTTRLKSLFHTPTTTIIPFGSLPLHAQMAEAAAYPAFYISGALTSWHVFGLPDAGLLTLTEVINHARTIASSVSIPIFCDADTGYGGPINVQRCVREFIAAGVAGIHIEDQLDPKKAGDQAGIELVSDEEAVGRLNAACAARDALDPDFVIVARTDGYTARGGSLEEAIRRGKLYKEKTGVDVVFVEGLHSWEETRRALKSIPGPTYAIPSRLAGPHPSLRELSEMGQAINILPFGLPGVQEVWGLLLESRERGDLSAFDEYTAKGDRLKGTERWTGWGDRWVKPSYAEVRQVEESFLPKSKLRDYENNGNVRLAEK
ncbi:hypothetical protein NX059_006350 [Plenodomus lindquistii]|nr:hypothetical protein NX059_006350 [Plenodomus lindquistii]